MSKVPSRSYCSACKKLAHGEYCKGGKCSCKCQYMTPEQISRLMSGKNYEEFQYSKESNDSFEKLLESFKQQ